MTDPVSLVLLAVGGLVAATFASVTGFGGAALLLPLTVSVFGVQDAIPIVTVAQLVGNASRVWFNRQDVSIPVTMQFALSCVPAAVLGGILFASVSSPLLLRLLGVLLIVMVVARHVPRTTPWRMPLWGFTPLGAVSGFLSALLGSVGPLVAPFFLAFGLVKGAYIGTEALAAVIMHVTKTATYGGMSLLTHHNVGMGLALAPVMIVGSYCGKRIVDRIPAKVFVFLVEGAMLAAGGRFLIVG